MPQMDPSGRWVSDDGRFAWDGTAWQPVAPAPAELFPAAPPAPNDPPAPGPAPAAVGASHRAASAAWSLGLGIFGLIAWLLPALGLPVAVAAVLLGVRARAGSRPALATAGIVLGVIALVLGTVNAAGGAFLALRH